MHQVEEWRIRKKRSYMSPEIIGVRIRWLEYNEWRDERYDTEKKSR